MGAIRDTLNRFASKASTEVDKANAALSLAESKLPALEQAFDDAAIELARSGSEDRSALAAARAAIEDQKAIIEGHRRLVQEANSAEAQRQREKALQVNKSRVLSFDKFLAEDEKLAGLIDSAVKNLDDLWCDWQENAAKALKLVDPTVALNDPAFGFLKGAGLERRLLTAMVRVAVKGQGLSDTSNMPRTNPLVTREVRARTLGSMGHETMLSDVPSAAEAAREARLLVRRAYERSVGVVSTGPAVSIAPIPIAAPQGYLPPLFDPFDPNVRKTPSPTLNMNTDSQDAGRPLPPNPPASSPDTLIPLREAPEPPLKSQADMDAAADRTLAVVMAARQVEKAGEVTAISPVNPHDPIANPEAHASYQAIIDKRSGVAA